MNKLVFTIIVFLFFPALLLSQNAEEVKIENLVNRKALLFNFNGFNLSSINGGIGWKKWNPKNFVIHNMIKVMFSRDKKDETSELRGHEKKQINFELTFGIQKQFNIINRMSPYLGGQIGIGYEKTTEKITLTERFGFYSSYDNKTKSTLINLSMFLIFGVEYFLKSNLSLSGQYQLGGYYGFGEENTNIFNETRNISKIHFGVWSSSLILSVYL